VLSKTRHWKRVLHRIGHQWWQIKGTIDYVKRFKRRKATKLDKNPLNFALNWRYLISNIAVRPVQIWMYRSRFSLKKWPRRCRRPWPRRRSRPGAGWKIQSDEVWNLYNGVGLYLYTWNGSNESPQSHEISAQSNCFCHVVPAGMWQA